MTPDYVEQVPRTIENTRILDETQVDKNDKEILADERDDEFAKYFNNEKVIEITSIAQ